MSLVAINLHGHLGENIGAVWNLDIKSVGEAMRAIEVVGGHKLYKYLLEQDKNGAKYRVLINGKDFSVSEPIDIDNPDTIAKSELNTIFHQNFLQSIDIVPVIEGAGSNGASIFTVILGAVLVVIGILAIAGVITSPLGVPLVVVGLGLIAAGVVNLLTKAPQFDDFENLRRQRSSYLFNGPYNTSEEGNPVPVGYGRLIVGSQVISASYDTGYSENTDVQEGQVIPSQPGDLDGNFAFLVSSLAWIPRQGPTDLEARNRYNIP